MKAKKTVLVIILIILICGLIFGIRVYQNGGGIQGILMTTLRHDEETIKNLEEINILALGSTDGELADTIIVVSYNPQTGELSMLSIPRDTFVGEDISSARMDDKINSLLDLDNPKRIINAAETITNIDIPYYIFVDTELLINLVDEIGGVWFDVPMNMKYDDYSQDLHIDLQKGYQLLDGNQAEQLVRFRKSNYNTTYAREYGADDYGRMRTGRNFAVATMRQTLRPENIVRIRSILNIMYNYVDTNISIDVVMDYIPYMVRI